ncbi:MAG: hypothetical protein EU531_04310 [Promethearchaeota archaeon]|nr:MAG: hypothetical protein EU531_04310 [Candidatus Lokiarchaeota archaeon]
MDVKKIEGLISSGNYEKAADDLFYIITKHQKLESDKELVYKSLNLLNKICDKSPSISLRAVKLIQKLIYDSNSWIRLVSLEILYQISLYRPNLLIDLIETIKNRFYDNEAVVKRLAVKIVGNLILSLHIDKDELYQIIDEFTSKLMDNDWKVKLQVIKTLKKILNQDYTKIRDFEPLLSIIIVNLRDADDDVARSAAELLKILGTYFLSKDKIMYVLLNLLYNEESRVKELIIWLLGEIGKEKSSEIIPVIPKLITLLKEDDYRIQLRVIDALVNISKNNFDQIWANLINALYSSDFDYRNVIINALYHLCQNNLIEVFNYIFEELENPSENVRDAVALVFKRLYEEYQLEIENEITKILYTLESKYWRERKKTILLLRNICLILESKKVAVWIFIELEKSLIDETDPDVKEEILYTLKNIKVLFSEIHATIGKVNEELARFQRRIREFQRMPADFREKMNSYIKNFKFRDTEIELDKIYRKLLTKIKKFNKKLNKFEYKRLAFNLIEDWEETKVNIIDELSIIKGFISDLFEEKKQEYTLSIKSKVKLFEDRINILKAQFEDLKEYSFPDDLDEILLSNTQDDALKEKFFQITQLRNYLFKLDDDIREDLVDNVEFNEIYKNLLRKWVNTKIEIQEYLSDLDRKIKVVKDKVVEYFVDIHNRKDIVEEQKINGIQKEMGFQLFQAHIQTLITQSIEGFKKFNNHFEILDSKIKSLIKKNEFSDVKKLIDMNTSQIQGFIEESENQIDNIVGKITEDNNVFNLFIRPYITKFIDTKELLINKLKSFNKKSNDKLLLAQIKFYLDISNRIKLENLASYTEMDTEFMNQKILKFIRKNKLNAKIIDDYLYSPEKEDILEAKDLLFFKNIKSIGNKIYFNFKLNNPTSLIFKDLQIALKAPPYLQYLKKESFPMLLFLDELKSGNVFKFNYVFKIIRESERKVTDHRVDEVILKLYYKDPFNINRKITKKINLLLP